MVIFKNCHLSGCAQPCVGDREALEPLNCLEMGHYRKPDLPLAGLPGGGPQTGREGWLGCL